MPTRGASAWQGWPGLRETLRQAGFFYEQAPLKKRHKLPEPLRLSIPHARNFVLCLSIFLLPTESRWIIPTRCISTVMGQ